MKTKIKSALALMISLGSLHLNALSIEPVHDPKLSYNQDAADSGKYFAFHVELEGDGLEGDGQEYLYQPDSNYWDSNDKNYSQDKFNYLNAAQFRLENNSIPSYSKISLNNLLTKYTAFSDNVAIISINPVMPKRTLIACFVYICSSAMFILC